MVTYGEWQQGPDYETIAGSGMFPHALGDPGWDLRQGVRSLTEHVEPPGFDTVRWQAEINNASAVGNWQVREPDTLNSLVAPLQAQYSSGFKPGTISDFWDTYRAMAASDLAAFSCWQARRDLPEPVGMPDGAATYEYETPTATALGAVLTAPEVQHWGNMGGAGGTWVYAFQPGAGYLEVGPLAGYINDSPFVLDWDAGQAFAAAVVGYDTETNAEILDPAVADMVAGYAGQPGGTVDVGADLDLTSHMFGDDGVVVLATKVRLAVIPNPPDGRDLNGGATLANWGTRYLLRPPRHRWVFPETAPPPGLPPNRIFPRDDGRATASAARVWPPPQSQQGSARIGPGSYY